MEQPPPLVPFTPRIVRREPLLRGPLILTPLARVLMLPFYSLCAVRATQDLRSLWPHPFDYVPLYIADLVAVTVGFWSLVLLSVLLAWLFLARHRMFRPLMIYFSVLPIVLFVGFAVHLKRFPRPHTRPDSPLDAWLGFGFTAAVVFWPLYYIFSPRVKRVFTR